MPVTIKYIGTSDNYAELPVTGKQSIWQIGQQEERPDNEASLLMATGLFYSPPVPVFAATNLTGGSIFSAAGKPVLEVLDGRVVSDDADTVPELEPVDWFPDFLLNGSSAYLYGRSASDARDFVRIDPVTRARTVVTNPWSVSSPRAIRSIMVTSASGVLLCSVGASSQTAASMEIWRSSDSGNSWAKVLTLGSANAGTINGIWTLSDRNFCEGVSGWYIGEYNVNSSRTDGGANDAVVLWKSTDQGATWAVNQTWNTGGSHQIRHIHALKRVDSKILICTGDSDAESAMILWDEAATVGGVALSVLTVPVQYGSQRSRIVDLAHCDDGYIYHMGDGATSATNSVSDVGWFRTKVGMSEYPERLDGKISAYPNRDIYYAAEFSTGALAFIEEITNTVTSDFSVGVWVTNESRSRIERVGAIRLSSATTGAVTPTMFQVGNTVYTAFASTVLGKGASIGTAAFTVSATKRWCGVRPDTIHPVYWVNPATGTDNADAERGFRPSLPFASLKYALEGNRVVQGARIILPEGDFTETLTTVIAPNTDQTNVDAATFTTVDGAGISKTKHSAGDASTVTNTFSLGAEQCRLEFKDIHLSTKRAVSTQAIFSGSGANSAQAMQFIRARVGGKDIGVLQAVVCNTNLAAGGSITVTAYDSEFVAMTVGASYLFTGDVDGPLNFTGFRVVFDGGRGAFNPASTDTISIEDGLFTNYTVTAIRAAATATKVPATKNCRFHSFVGLPQWIDDGTLTESGQWVGARCTNPLSPSAIFDATSKVDTGAAPKDPRSFNYERSSG